MRAAIGADHAGFSLKENLVSYLKGLGHEVHDVGAHSPDPEDDYPDYAELGILAVDLRLLASSARGFRNGHEEYATEKLKSS